MKKQYIQQPKHTKNQTPYSKLTQQHTLKKKKVILHKNIESKITIKLDQFIKQTYTRPQKNIQQFVPNQDNKIFMEYIKYIYKYYGIEDGEFKYNKGVSNDIKSSLSTRAQTIKKKYQTKQCLNQQPYQPIQKVIQLSFDNQIDKKNKKQQKIFHNKTEISNFYQSKIDRLKKKLKLNPSNDQNHHRIQKLNKSRSQLKQKNFLNTTRSQIQKKQLSKSIQYCKQKKNHLFNEDKSQNFIVYNTPDNIKSKQINQSQTKNSNKFNTTRTRNINISEFKVNQNIQIQPIFRYCFICQNPILQTNIMSHQKTCQFFSNIYSQSPERITNILLNKIQRIKHEIQVILSKSQENCQQKVKNTTKQWISSVKNCYKTGKFTKQYQQKYLQLQKGFQLKFFKLIQLTQKLKWFLQIRQKINLRFDI